MCTYEIDDRRLHEVTLTQPAVIYLCSGVIGSRAGVP